MRRLVLLIALFGVGMQFIYSQGSGKGKIEGRIYNSKNNEPVEFATIVILNTQIGSYSDIDGKFTFTGIAPGFIQLKVTSVGFDDYISEEIQVTNANVVNINIPLTDRSYNINEIKIVSQSFRKIEESPVSIQRIGIGDIEKNPGGNRDISKVIQSFPGVGSGPSFRNDVIIRGGGPNENTFMLDGIEIPNINHFATQGASGGPVGIINVDFLREVNYYSGAFPVNYGDALSSVLDFKLKDGNIDKLKTRATIGASDLALTFDGPLSKKTSFIFSARRSYLQFLFSAIGLPFLPTYNDFQLKTKTSIDKKNQLTFIGLGAIDDFVLNTKANETEEQRYILKYLPVNIQRNYTVGSVYTHFNSKGYSNFVLSRSFLRNINYKYQDNIEIDSLKILDYTSNEIENKFRFEHITRPSGTLKFIYGLNLEQAIYTNSTFRKNVVKGIFITENYNSDLQFFKWGLFGNASKKFLDNRLTLSLGLRTDANNYSTEMMDLTKQLSPRLSASYQLTSKLTLNANTGRYFQLPPYTALGYRDVLGNLVNKTNKISYISVDHIVTGFEYQFNEKTRISIEGFYKNYQKYPWSVSDSVSIASKGGDFGTFGDEELLSISKGRSYGTELFYRYKLADKINIIVSYTLFRSEFKDVDNYLNELSSNTPTAWDNKHLLNIVTTKSFKRNWDLGFKWRFVGGFPYTPIDFSGSSNVLVWNSRGRALLDYDKFNQNRLSSFHQLDFRIDKGYFFNKWSLMIYFDVQNAYNNKSEEPDRLTIEQEDGSIRIVNPQDNIEQQNYDLRVIKSAGQGTILPTLGIMVEF